MAAFRTPKKPAKKAAAVAKRSADRRASGHAHERPREVVEAELVEETALAVPERGGAALGLWEEEQEHLLSGWLRGKSPDTLTSYRRSVQHFAKWVRTNAAEIAKKWIRVDAKVVAAKTTPKVIEKEQERVATQRARFVERVAKAADASVVQLLCAWPEIAANGCVQEWIDSQREAGNNSGSIQTRVCGVVALWRQFKRVQIVSYHLEVERPKTRKKTKLEQYHRLHGVPEAFVSIMKALRSRWKPLYEEKGEPAEEEEEKIHFAFRDWALLLTAALLGLRRIEIVRLDVAHLDFKAATVTVLGKGRDAKEPVTMPKVIVETLQQWLALRAAWVGRKDGPLFPSLGIRARMGEKYGRLKRDAINKMVRRRAVEFGVALKPHDMRRIFSTEAIKETKGDLSIAKGITRHDQEATLAGYDLRQGEQMIELANTVAERVMAMLSDGEEPRQKRKKV